jgi:hypothetical protein
MSASLPPRPGLATLIGGGLLASASAQAYSDGITGLTAAGPLASALGLCRLCQVHVQDLKAGGDSARFALRWVTGPGGLFPALDADITLAPAGKHSTTLTLTAVYRTPLGMVSADLDWVIWHGAAAATIQAFLQLLAAAIARPARVAEPAGSADDLDPSPDAARARATVSGLRPGQAGVSVPRGSASAAQSCFHRNAAPCEGPAHPQRPAPPHPVQRHVGGRTPHAPACLAAPGHPATRAGPHPQSHPGPRQGRGHHPLSQATVRAAATLVLGEVLEILEIEGGHRHVVREAGSNPVTAASIVPAPALCAAAPK